MKLKSPPLITAYTQFGQNVAASFDPRREPKHMAGYDEERDRVTKWGRHGQSSNQKSKHKINDQNTENIYGRVHVDSTLPSRFMNPPPHYETHFKENTMDGALMRFGHNDRNRSLVARQMTKVEDSHYAMTTDLDDLDEYGKSQNGADPMPVAPPRTAWEWWGEQVPLNSFLTELPSYTADEGVPQIKRQQPRQLGGHPFDDNPNCGNYDGDKRYVSQLHREAATFAYMVAWLTHVLILFVIFVTSISPLPWIVGHNIKNPGSLVGGLWGFCITGFKMRRSVDQGVDANIPICTFFGAKMENPTRRDRGDLVTDVQPTVWSWILSLFDTSSALVNINLHHMLGAWAWFLGLALVFIGMGCFVLIYLGIQWTMPKILDKTRKSGQVEKDGKKSKKAKGNRKAYHSTTHNLNIKSKSTFSQNMMNKVSRHVILCSGCFILLATIPLILSCILYPMSWDIDVLKVVCGRRMKPYHLGDCSLGLGYYIALLCSFNGISLGCLGIGLANKIPQFQSATKFRLSKKYTSDKKYWKTDNDILSYNFGDDVVLRKPILMSDRQSLDKDKSIYSYLPSNFKDDKAGYNMKF